MHGHHPDLASISAQPRAIAADTPLVWIGGPPADDDARLVWVAVTARARATYAAVIDETAEHLFHRDLARLGGSADLGLFQPFYRAYAREVVLRLEGTHLRIEDAR
jgi:hypothetical protein